MVQPISMPIRHWLTPRSLLAAAWLPAAVMALTALTALTAQAQPGALGTRPDPLDPKASIPTLVHPSSFSQYRRLDEGKLISWRDANDTVTRIGGWRVYAREAQQPDLAAPMAPDAAPSAAPSASAPTARPARPASPASAPKSNEMVKPMPAGHGGHKMP